MERDHRIYLAFKKYGLKNFTWEKIETVEDTNLDDREIHYIKTFDSFKRGYNCNRGGFSVSEETRKKLSQIFKGRIITWAHKARATRIKNGGYIVSDSTKKKLSGKNSAMAKKYIVTEPDGTDHIVHGLRAWCKAWGKDKLNHGELSRCATGEYKQHHGYKCRYFKAEDLQRLGESRTPQAIGGGNGESLYEAVR